MLEGEEEAPRAPTASLLLSKEEAAPLRVHERVSHVARGDLDPLQVEQGLPGEDDADQAGGPPRRAQWGMVVLFSLSVSIGVSVLTLASALSTLGWVLGVSAMIALCLCNVYSGMLLFEAETLCPGSVGQVELARNAVRQPAFTAFTAAVMYVYFFLISSLIFLLFGELLQEIFAEVVQLCTPAWGALGCLLLFPLLLFRTFHAMRWVLVLNMACFYASMFTLVGVFVVGVVERGAAETVAVGSTLDWVSFTAAIGKIELAFMGTELYLQFMAEMETVAHFPRSLGVSNAAVFLTYLVFASSGYVYHGASEYSSLVHVLPINWVTRSAYILLAIHVVISYVLNAHPLHTALHRLVFPATVNKPGALGQLHWAIVSALSLAINYSVANSVPFFGQLTSLVGVLVTPFLAHILPVAALWTARVREGSPPGPAQVAGYILLLLYAAFLTTAGTAAAVFEIAASFQAEGAPFARCSGNRSAFTP